MPATMRSPASWAARWGVRLALLLFALLLAAPAGAVERRRNQFPSDEAYLFVPFPYSLPGIGQGIAYTVLAANFLSEHMDVYGLLITGDAHGNGIGIEDIHIVNETLIFNMFSQNIDRAAVNSYQTRGMDSPGDQYYLLEVNKANSLFAELRLTLAERQFELYTGGTRFESALIRVRDAEGNIVADFAEPLTNKATQRYAGMRIDLTDDYGDPRKGVRLETTLYHTPPDNDDQPDYYVWNYSINGYIPLGSISTLLLSYFQSDADVHRKGNTDPVAIAQDVALLCDPTDVLCQAIQQQLLEQEIAARANGTASSLGGQNRLRSFPGDRFNGAHTVFYATELRWNLTEEVTPFDYFIWKDVRTNVQLAFFWETGSVAETRADIGDFWRSSYGAGLRMVSGSGFVYRADVATGDEGSEVTIIFSYPY